MSKFKKLIFSTILVAGASFAASGCHLQPYNVCKIYMPDRTPEIYHWHSKSFANNGQIYIGGYHCRVFAQDGQPAITFWIGEQENGDTDFLDGDYIH